MSAPIRILAPIRYDRDRIAISLDLEYALGIVHQWPVALDHLSELLRIELERWIEEGEARERGIADRKREAIERQEATDRRFREAMRAREEEGEE